MHLAKFRYGATAAKNVYTFRRLLLHNGISPGAKFTLHPRSLALSYWQRYCTAVEQWVRAKLCGAEHRAPPTFGRAPITLGIGHILVEVNITFLRFLIHHCYIVYKLQFFMAALWNRAGHYIFVLWFLLFLFFA